MLPQLTSSTEQPSAFALTADDVRRLLDDKTAAVRLEMTDRLATSHGSHHLNPTEMQVAEQIFRLLARDTELRVRVSLAEHVKCNPHIAHDIVLSLAKDVEEVSLPVLEYSEVLSDTDLVELVNSTHEVSRFLAVSRRRTVSDTVSDVLLDKGNDEVASVLVHNKGAQISETGFHKIIEAYRDNKSLMRAVHERPRLPVAAAEKLIHIVSSSLADKLTQKYNLPSEQIQQEVDKVHEGETLNLVRLSHSQEDVDRLVNQLQAFGRLSPSIILSALCQGNFGFFETSIAHLSGISLDNARRLISDRGDLGFRAIYNKSGLSDAMFPAVKLLLRVVRELDGEGEKPSSPRYANRVVERILQYSEETPIENLSYIIALVRRIAQ